MKNVFIGLNISKNYIRFSGYETVCLKNVYGNNSNTTVDQQFMDESKYITFLPETTKCTKTFVRDLTFKQNFQQFGKKTN